MGNSLIVLVVCLTLLSRLIAPSNEYNYLFIKYSRELNSSLTEVAGTSLVVDKCSSPAHIQ